jgi:hypothetical protein
MIYNIYREVNDLCKNKAIPEGFMTVGEAAKKWMLPSARCNTTIRRVCSPRHQKARAAAGFIRTKIWLPFIRLCLWKQADDLREKIEQMTASLKALEQLKAEVLQMQTVNFKKYADIIVNLQ